jgi:hypothetical protein
MDTEETFVCEECGGTFPRRQMKEAFVWHGRERVRRQLHPACLDKAMAEGRVSGIVGQEKKAAVQITPGEDAGVRKPIR